MFKYETKMATADHTGKPPEIFYIQNVKCQKTGQCCTLTLVLTLGF